MNFLKKNNTFVKKTLFKFKYSFTKTFLFFSLSFLVSFSHPIYLSISTLKYNSKEKTIQTTFKINANDLEVALNKINFKSVDLLNTKDTLATALILKNYLTTHFKLKINGELKYFVYLGHEFEQEAIWIYVEYQKINLPYKIEIENTVLCDFIKTQQNIVSFEINAKTQSDKLSCTNQFLKINL